MTRTMNPIRYWLEVLIRLWKRPRISRPRQMTEPRRPDGALARRKENGKWVET